MKSPKFDMASNIVAYSIENKIFALQDKCSKVFTYDTNKNEWSEKSCKFTKNLWWFSGVNVPC